MVFSRKQFESQFESRFQTDTKTSACYYSFMTRRRDLRKELYFKIELGGYS